MTLNHSVRETKPRTSAKRIVVYILLALAVSVLCLAGVIGGMIWNFASGMDKVTVTLINQSSQRIDSAAVIDWQGTAVLTFAAIEPGQRSSKTVHFDYDRGPCELQGTLAGAPFAIHLGHLLNDDGPFDYTVTIKPNGIHIDGYEADGGSFKRDAPLVAPQ